MPETKEKWIEIVISTPEELSDSLSNFMVELDTQGVSQEEPEQSSFNDTPALKAKEELKAYLPFGSEAEKKISSLQVYMDSLHEMFPDLEKPAFVTHTIVDPDWGEQWKKYFKPLRVSKNIVIKPTWERYQTGGRDIVIDIDPGMAFGTGQHPSTQLCIVAIEELLLKDRSFDKWTVLDIGTGTGILAICSAKLGSDRVLAVDIDEKAIEIASKNVVINGVDEKIELINDSISTRKGTFNLIVANLTAKTLIQLKPQIMNMTVPGGYVIASGIIDQDTEAIEKHFVAEDMAIHDIKSEQEWFCYTFKKRNRK
ncbi:MAG: 50S ribosomal protein L11 methyltransferase [Deltaproteobacteria bacterium]|nr:50S ribosomal protein L11 methyltransferase [Deltaproteobacteria bacterium]MBN2845149.1 50S ribosomal protein L11 methyltransferase [Deltaproteobacteria bacterium]